MKKRDGASIHIGASSILVIFVLLCITTFSTLSLLSANADLRLTRRAQQMTTDYWNANNEAQRILAAIDADLLRYHREAATEAGYYEAAYAGLSTGTLAGSVEFELGRDHVIRYTVPVNDAQELVVELTLDYSPARYRKTAWQLRSTVDWDALQEPIHIWDGTESFLLS